MNIGKMKAGSSVMTFSSTNGNNFFVKLETTKGAPSNPEFRDSDGWTCKITNQNKQQYTFPFYMGRGHEGRAPQVQDVMDCLICDLSSYELVDDVERFSYEYGYSMSTSEDRKRVQRIYNGCKRTANALHRMFTDEQIRMIHDRIND